MIVFDSDMTLRWACRQGDFVIWARFQGILCSPGHEYKISDIWELRDGNFVTITNRLCDLPPWLDLHPLEVSGSRASQTKKRLHLEQPIEAPNVWRVFAGDRIVWVGPTRGGVHSEDGVLELADFKQNALVYGEPFDFSSDFQVFGGFDRGEPSPEGTRLCTLGWNAIVRLGLPRVITADDRWHL